MPVMYRQDGNERREKSPTIRKGVVLAVAYSFLIGVILLVVRSN